MTSTTASVIADVDDDFLLRQRGELNARRRSYRDEQVERLAAAAEELAEAGAEPDLGDEQGFGEARPEAVPEATQRVRCASGSIRRRS